MILSEGKSIDRISLARTIKFHTYVWKKVLHDELLRLDLSIPVVIVFDQQLRVAIERMMLSQSVGS